MRGIVLFAHGSRDPEWARPLEAIRDRVRKSRPEYPISLAFLEQMAPNLEDAVDALAAEGASCITIFPLFIAQGGHLRRDLPRIVEAIRAAHPHVPNPLTPRYAHVRRPSSRPRLYASNRNVARHESLGPWSARRTACETVVVFTARPASVKDVTSSQAWKTPAGSDRCSFSSHFHVKTFGSSRPATEVKPAG